MAPTAEFTDNLKELKAHYQEQLEALESQKTETQQQLTHVEALLGSISEGGIPVLPAVEIEAEETPAPKSAKRATRKKTTPAKAKATQTTRTASAKAAPKTTAKSATKTTPKTAAKKTTKTAKKTPVSRKGQAPVIKLQLKKAYAKLSKIDAVAKVLSDRKGKPVTTTEIITELFGKLDSQELQEEKVRMKDVLNRGIRRTLWHKVAGQVGTYMYGEEKQPKRQQHVRQQQREKQRQLDEDAARHNQVSLPLTLILLGQ